MKEKLKKHPLWELYKKELAGKKLEFSIISILTIIINVIILAKLDSLSNNGDAAAVAFSIAIPASFVFVWVLWAGFRSLGQEWELNTSYLLLSLPISGVKLLLMKLMAILTIFTAFLIEIGVFSIIMFLKSVGFEQLHLDLSVQEVFMVLLDLLLVYIYFLAVVSTIVILCQFAFIISRLVSRFSKIFVVVSTVVSIWIFFRGSYLLSKVINLFSIPDVKFLIAEDAGLYMNSSPVIAWICLTVIFFLATSKLYERVVEV